MKILGTQQELQQALGDSIRDLRLARNLGQAELAARAGIGRSAMQNLETGRGNLTTLVRVIRALGREDWLAALAPQITVNPLHAVRQGRKRRRASGGRRGKPSSD